LFNKKLILEKKYPPFNGSFFLYSRCLKQEVDEVKHQIRIRENRIEKLTAKYDIILKSLGGRLEVGGKRTSLIAKWET
jgi:hypothetical protein